MLLDFTYYIIIVIMLLDFTDTYLTRLSELLGLKKEKKGAWNYW